MSIPIISTLIKPYREAYYAGLRAGKMPPKVNQFNQLIFPENPFKRGLRCALWETGCNTTLLERIKTEQKRQALARREEHQP